MYRTTTLVGGKRTVIVGIAVSMFASAGVAAAATGNAPWSTEPTTSGQVVTDPAVTDPTSTTPPTPTTASVAPASEPSPATTVPAPTSSDVLGPIITTTLPLEPATSVPATSVFLYVPPTSPAGDTQVPLGISLTCTQAGDTVTCSWSGVQLEGFHELLLLRGDGTLGRVPFRTGDPSGGTYVDSGLAAGSYSYVMVALDGNSTTLVHSNGVHVEIAAG